MTSPRERELLSRIAAYKRWSKEPDRPAATAPARAAFLSGFEKQVDPDGTLAPEERARRAECARKAHFLKMALRSAQARARKDGGAA